MFKHATLNLIILAKNTNTVTRKIITIIVKMEKLLYKIVIDLRV